MERYLWVCTRGPNIKEGDSCILFFLFFSLKCFPGVNASTFKVPGTPHTGQHTHNRIPGLTLKKEKRIVKYRKGTVIRKQCFLNLNRKIKLVWTEKQDISTPCRKAWCCHSRRSGTVTILVVARGIARDHLCLNKGVQQQQYAAVFNRLGSYCGVLNLRLVHGKCFLTINVQKRKGKA